MNKRCASSSIVFTINALTEVITTKTRTNPVSSPVKGSNPSEMLERGPVVGPTAVEDTQEVEPQAMRVFFEMPRGVVGFDHLSPQTRGFDIAREKGSLVYWKASRLFLTHNTAIIAMSSSILEEAPEIKKGDTLFFRRSLG